MAGVTESGGQNGQNGQNGLITWLLDINVGGISGTENQFAFAGVCALLVVFGVAQYLFFKGKRWL